MYSSTSDLVEAQAVRRAFTESDKFMAARPAPAPPLAPPPLAPLPLQQQHRQQQDGGAGPRRHSRRRDRRGAAATPRLRPTAVVANCRRRLREGRGWVAF
jgi:hypothetical protein